MKCDKNRIAIIFLLAFTLWNSTGVAQELSRKTIHGQVINDSLKVEQVVIFNISAKLGAVLKSSGYFDIKARENDTLVFSSLLFRSKRIVLTQADMKASELVVKLETFTNELAEVVIDSKNKIKPVTGSKRDIVDQKYVDDPQSTPRNTVMPGNVTENGMDFVRIYKDVMRLLNKNKAEKNSSESTASFMDYVMKKIKYPFYSRTLKLQDDEIKLFLLFSESDVRVPKLVKSKSEFELMDYLIEKNKDFQDLKAQSTK